MKILIAEDDPTSRTVLTILLNKLGHEVIASTNGLEAWQIMSSENPPKIAILDWMMPKMDGIEVCRRIRACNKAYTYIIMQTAKTDRKDIETGFSVGVDDYLTKPLDAVLLRHKLLVATRILKYEDQLSDYSQKMETLANERGRQLAHADRLATLGVLSSGIAHEINNPATFISGNAQMIEMLWPEILKRLPDCSTPTQDNKRLTMIIEEIPSMLNGIKTGVERITKIISGLKSYARENKIKKQKFHISTAIKTSLELCHNRVKNGTVIETLCDESLPEVIGDIQQIEQVLINLIVNAADAMDDSIRKSLTIRAIQENQHITISVEDSGSGIPQEILDKVFNPFFTTKSEHKGTGLGLSISKGIIEEHGGTLTATNIKPSGAKFVFTIPINSAL